MLMYAEYTHTHADIIYLYDAFIHFLSTPPPKQARSLHWLPRSVEETGPVPACLSFLGIVTFAGSETLVALIH